MAHSITTFLMFDGDAQEAITLYTSLFDGSKVTSMELYGEGEEGAEKITGIQRLPAQRPLLNVIKAPAQELGAHEGRLDALEKSSGNVIWRAE